MNIDATRILTRCPQNPLMKVEDYPGIAQLYNPSAVRMGDEIVMLVSVVEHAGKHGIGRDVGQTRVARSKDGIHFELETEDFIKVPESWYNSKIYHQKMPFYDNSPRRFSSIFSLISSFVRSRLKR